ncbi:hypothetical protein [Altererythrobacter aquiaggeris]|uniref:hypothetical protein n=1 Tax=Aestuarierythrobacter aquiaggeris TaxID=1898396 RepID=UPI00301941BB
MIEISTDVYAAIWSARLPSENNENEVLQRILKVEKPKSSSNGSVKVSSGLGFYDSRNDVSFEEGFRIFRDYKGKRFDAVATGGQWVRADNGKPYASLNQLNASIAAGAENVWNGNWKYQTSGGRVWSIDNLRN